MELTDEDLASIADELIAGVDGSTATFELADGNTLALCIETDYDTSVRDYDTYGAFSEYSYNYDRDDGKDRPAEMNGNAEKLQVDYDAFVWWQPPEDGPKRGSEEFRTFREMVKEIAENGYVGLVVELRDGEDAAGRPHALKIAQLWGIENIYATFNGDKPDAAEVVADLVAEVLADDEPRDDEGKVN